MYRFREIVIYNIPALIVACATNGSIITDLFASPLILSVFLSYSSTSTTSFAQLLSLYLHCLLTSILNNTSARRLQIKLRLNINIKKIKTCTNCILINLLKKRKEIKLSPFLFSTDPNLKSNENGDSCATFKLYDRISQDSSLK